MQQRDFAGIFRAMSGLPVTIRLLDPPLHEFLPRIGDDAEVERLRAGELGVALRDAERLLGAGQGLHEANPMLGHRGCRLGVAVPGDLRDAGARDRARPPARCERGGDRRRSRRS